MIYPSEYPSLSSHAKPVEKINKLLQTNRARFLIVITVMAVLLVCLVFLIGWFTKVSREEQADIDMACNQGELLRDIYLLMLAGDQQQELAYKVNLFEENLTILENGERAEIEGQAAITLFPEDGYSVKDDLKGTHASWDRFKQLVAQGGEISSADLQKQYVQIEIELDKVMDDLLLRQIGDYRILVGALLAFVFLSFVVLVFSYFFLTKKLISPLSVLGKIANRISAGDLTTPLQGFGHDEIGLLASSIDQMRASIAENTRTMEERIASQNREIRTAFEFSQEIVSQLDFDQLMVSIVTKARELSKAKEITLCLQMADTSWVRMHARKDVIEQSRDSIAPCMTLSGRNQGCYFFETPLKVRGEAIGFLCALVDEQVVLSDEDMQAFTLLANSSAIAIENARLMAENMKQVQSSAQLAERQQIAAELHDSLAQMLSLLKIQIGQVLVAKLDSSRAQVVFYELMQKIQLNIDHANRQVRSLINGLSENPNATPVTPDVECEIQEYIKEFRTVTPLDLSVDIAYREFQQLPPLVLRQIFLIMRETLANITRHARASRVGVKIARDDDRMLLEVVDDGVGFDPTSPIDEVHMGLKIMRARAERVAGQLDLISQPGAGTRVVVNIPLAVGVEQGLVYA